MRVGEPHGTDCRGGKDRRQGVRLYEMSHILGVGRVPLRHRTQRPRVVGVRYRRKLPVRMG